MWAMTSASFVYIPTWEEIRVIELITKIANNTKVIKSKRDVFVWSSTEGLNKLLTTGQEKVNINNAENPTEALNYIARACTCVHRPSRDSVL